MGEFVNNVLSDIEIKTTRSCFTEVKIGGKQVKCRAYTLEQRAGEFPVVTLEMIPIVKGISLKGIVKIGNMEEIAMFMSESEFEEFCTIWRSFHECKELLE